MPKQNTRIESEGAEFLALGHLLRHGVLAYKTYTNMPGYDLVALNPNKKLQVTIQVKSRWRTGAPFFLIKNLECDFVIAVKLNLGKKDGSVRPSEPTYYILPIDIVKRLLKNKDKAWSKVRFKEIDSSFENNWDLIRHRLQYI